MSYEGCAQISCIENFFSQVGWLIWRHIKKKFLQITDEGADGLIDIYNINIAACTRTCEVHYIVSTCVWYNDPSKKRKERTEVVKENLHRITRNISLVLDAECYT